MDKLSPEILAIIVAELFAGAAPAGSPRLGVYATISRRWQDYIEARTFESIMGLILNTEELSTFESVFRDARRQSLLRRLSFEFVPPALGNLHAEHIANSAALGSGLKSLFKLLSAWETNGHSIKLIFGIDHLHYTPARRYWMLDQPETVLAKVLCVSYLSISDRAGTALHPTAGAKLISSLPNLQALSYQFYDPDPKRLQLRKEIRKALATSLRSLELPMLQRLDMTQEPDMTIFNHSFECGDLCDEDGVDPLSSAIRDFSQRTPIERLELKNFLVSRELFTGQDPESTWPALQQFDIDGNHHAPSGKWYWTGDPTSTEPGSTRGYGSDISPSSSVQLSSDSDISWHREDSLHPDNSGSEDDYNRDAIRNGLIPMYQWRDKPNWDMLSPLLVAMARAVQRMPNLQRGRLYLENRGAGNICVQCAAPGFRYADFDKYEPKSFRTCRFFVGDDYDLKTWLPLEQLPGEVRSAWREWLGDGEMETGPFWRPLISTAIN